MNDLVTIRREIAAIGLLTDAKLSNRKRRVIGELMQHASAAEARLEAVKALHRSDGGASPTCWGCGREWPCPTEEAMQRATALSVAPRPPARPGLPVGPWIVKDDYVIALGEDGAPAILQVMNWGQPEQQAALATEVVRLAAPQPEPDERDRVARKVHESHWMPGEPMPTCGFPAEGGLCSEAGAEADRLIAASLPVEPAPRGHVCNSTSSHGAECPYPFHAGGAS